MVNLRNYIFLFAAVFFLTACPAPRYKSDLKRLQENGMDFPDLEQTYYKGIEFWISDMFTKDYSDGYVLTDDAKAMVVYSVDVNFSVERFDTDDAEVIQYSFDDDIPQLDAVHDNYIIHRQESLYSPVTSIKKEVPKSVGFPGYIQVVHGSSSSSYGEKSSYFTATLQVGNYFYVFQMIGLKENMGYLYDDFIDIISSVQV